MKVDLTTGVEVNIGLVLVIIVVLLVTASVFAIWRWKNWGAVYALGAWIIFFQIIMILMLAEVIARTEVLNIFSGILEGLGG